VIDNNDELIEFYTNVQPEAEAAAIDRRISRLDIQRAHGRSFLYADGTTGIVQLLYLFGNAEDAARFVSSAPPGYDDSDHRRETDNPADETSGFAAEFDAGDLPTGFATIVSRYDNLVTQLIVGTTGIDDPFVTAEELERRQDERLLSYVAGDELTSLEEENAIVSAPDPRAQAMADVLLVEDDLEAHGTFEVLAETPNDNAEAVIAFLSSSEDIVPALEDLLDESGFVTGYGRLLSSGRQDENGLAIISQALLFDTAEGAAAFVNGSTDLELGAEPGIEHPEIVLADGARTFCRPRPNGGVDCEVRFSRDNVFALVALLNFNTEGEAMLAIDSLARIMDGLIQDRP
ncbi:MAG TPA: hypothetical protein VFZ12_09300, partial [Dehalococcoidia bacterium]|nr:hypothetical protein [Dehalococcoidia bacterium]